MTPTSKEALEVIEFRGGRLGRPLTLLEIARETNSDPAAASAAVDELAADGRVRIDGPFATVPGVGPGGADRTAQDFLLDRKWRRFLRLAKVFRRAPFVEAVFVGGSLALGNVSETSDFDLLAVVRTGRMFTARYVLIALAFLRGVRRRTDDPARETDRFCLNHFVTRETWSKEPHNRYRTELHRSLVPVWGDEGIISSFIAANEWCGRAHPSLDDFRWQGNVRNPIRHLVETILSGEFGNFVEYRIARPVAMRRLSRYLGGDRSTGGRVVVTDSELEFHLAIPYEHP